MFLLDMPNKKAKKDRYIKANRKLLDNIPTKDTLDGVLKEDKAVLEIFNDNIKNLNDLDPV